jgi:hypothetical protein
MESNPLREFFTPSQLADRWQISEKTLRNHRSKGTGCPYSKMLGLVRYAGADVLMFEQSAAVVPTERPRE